MRRRFSLLLAGLALLPGAPAAWSATAAFNIGGTCAANCAQAGFDPDDLIGGVLVLSTDNFAPSGAVVRADVVSFGILIGEGPTGIFKPEAPAWNFAATWGADTQSIENVSFVASGADGLRTDGLLFSTGSGGNQLTLRGLCADVLCSAPFFNGPAATLSPIRYTPREVAPIPLPATAPLAVAGALALAALGRRRRHPADCGDDRIDLPRPEPERSGVRLASSLGGLGGQPPAPYLYPHVVWYGGWVPRPCGTDVGRRATLLGRSGPMGRAEAVARQRAPRERPRRRTGRPCGLCRSSARTRRSGPWRTATRIA
ncbi:MAG: hypothetical protein U1E59_11075 [Amaricoccus sp.]